jgi:hypothetical protein
VTQLAREIRDGYAQLIERADRFNDKLNRKNNFFRLDPALAKDQRPTPNTESGAVDSIRG